MIVALSVAAGCVDAASYLNLGDIFTANMTGNTVLLGLALGEGNWLAVLRAGLALLGFVGGVAVGTLVSESGSHERKIWPFAVTMGLALELVFLAAFAVGWNLAGPEPSGRTLHYLIVLSAISMGVQSTAVRQLGIPGVATTYITGTLTNLTEGAIRHLRSAGSSVIKSQKRSEQEKMSARGLLLPADVWLAYGLGAIAAGALQLRWSPGVPLMPAAIVGLVILGALLRFGYR